MTSRLLQMLTNRRTRRRDRKLPPEFRRLSSHMRADVGYPASDEDDSIYPYNFRF